MPIKKVIYNPSKALALGQATKYEYWARLAQVNLAEPFLVIREEDSFGEPCYVVERQGSVFCSHVGKNIFDLWLEKPINLDDYL